MGKKSGTGNKDLENALISIKEMESRISKLETLVENKLAPKLDSKDESNIVELNFRRRSGEKKIEKEREIEKEGGEIESQIGEYGMAWLGNIVLLIGIIFLVQFFKNQDHKLFSSVFGFASVAGIYILGYFLNKQHPYMSKLFSFNGHILLFIVTLQLHFFTSDPLINNKILGLIILLLVISSLTYLAYQNRSQILAGIIMTMFAIAAIASNSTHIMLSLTVIITILSLTFLYKLGWRSLTILAIFFVYITFLLWFFNNPIITRSLEAVGTLQGSYIYLSICALLFSMIAILPLKNKINESQINTSIILNGLGFSLIIALICVNFFKDNYFIILGIIAASGIAFSALLQSRGVLKLSAALYALYGFALLSITIGGIFKFPLAFLLLSIESLLVVSMALWFRSRFIVSMNLVMFIGLLMAYILSKSPVYSIDISFAVVALVTARIINWKKDNLEIRTEWIRNMYLIMAFIMTLVSLYHAVPQNYITLSWALSAVLFFSLSLLLHNVKYRWLAIAAMLSAAVYFFLIDLGQVSIGYRILALLVLAAISFSFSIYYAKRMRKRKSDTI